MSVRVNLLPREYEERNRRRRAGIMVGLGGAAFMAVLVALYMVQLAAVGDAQRRLDDENAELAALRAREGELVEYRDLRDEAETTDAVIAAALADEQSFAGILQDVSAVMPGDAELTALTYSVDETEADAEGDATVAADGVRPQVGRLTITGNVLQGHAPGLERLMLEFDKVVAFSNVYLTGSTLDERGVAAFSAEIDLGPEALTGRYANGLPEQLR